MIIVISASALLFFAISSVVLFRRRANSTRRQITEIRKETDKYQRELENAERTSRGDKKEIERLRKKLEQGEARLSAILDRGKDLYDSVKLDGNVSRWSKDDFEAVVEYLRAKMPDEVRMIEETHTKLTAYATFSCFYQPQAQTPQTRHALWAYRKEPSEPCATDSRRRKTQQHHHTRPKCNAFNKKEKGYYIVMEFIYTFA